MSRYKTCFTCKKKLNIKEFPLSPKHKGGLYPYCKACHSLYQDKRRPNYVGRCQVKEELGSLKSRGLKRCSHCRQVGPITEFYTDLRHKDGKQSRCKVCFLGAQRGPYWMKEYGLSVEEVKKLFDYQDGLCAICKKPPRNFRLNIDHCHKTNRVRAMLCVNCNTNLLPYVEYQGEAVAAAFLYLKDPPAFKVLGERIVPETNQARRKKKGIYGTSSTQDTYNR